MIIKLHRWQPKSNRFRTQNLKTTDVNPFVEMIFNRGIQLTTDLGVNQMIMRTQRVDRVVFEHIDGSEPVINVYLSPIIERKYELKHPAQGSTRKKTALDRKHSCECHHLDSDHAISGICLIPGCACKTFSAYVPLDDRNSPSAY